MRRLLRHRPRTVATIGGLLMLLAMPAAARAAALSVTPGLPERGARVTVGASGLEAGSRGVAQLAGARTRRFRVDARGRATIRLHLRRAIRTGSRRLRVRAGARSVTTSITVVRRRGTPSRLAALSGGRRVLLRPTSGRPGGRIDLRISGHPRRATLDVRLGDSALARRRTSSRGALTVRAATPAVAAGLRTITVSARRRSLTLPYTVLSAPGQPQGPPGTSPVPPPAPSGDAAVLVGAGDIADCNNPGDEATAALLDGIPGTVFTTGDNVYPTATLSQLNNCYSSSWGRHKARTRPVVGNHEYDSSGNTGHFDYFGAAAGPVGKGYYSYDLGGWHVVVLNSNCAFVGGCHAGSAQEQWLRADLAASSADCTVAMMHHPRFSSGSTHGSNTAMTPFWQALYDAGAELVLAGHEHSYERFAAMTPSGVADSTFGLRSFVIGTGGFSHYPLGTPLPNSQARNSGTFGVVKFTLRDGSYDWQFVPETGKTYTDLGSGTCHGKPASAPPPADEFSDGFESGDFSGWTSWTTKADGSAVVQTAIVHGGSRAARLKATSTSGSAAYLRKSLSPSTDMTAGGWFNLQAEGDSNANVPLLRMFDGSGKRLISLYRQNQSGDQLWVQHSGTYNKVAATLPLRTWAQVSARVVVAGTSSTVEIFVNGARVYQTSSASLGTSAVATIQVGNDTAAQPFDIVVDDVTADSPAV